jgi:hypothetical protein
VLEGVSTATVAPNNREVRKMVGGGNVGRGARAEKGGRSRGRKENRGRNRKRGGGNEGRGNGGIGIGIGE